jgi:hypothetical protein
LVVTKQRAFVPEVTDRLVVTKQRAFVPIVDPEGDRYKVTKAEVGAFLDVPDGFSAAKVEVGAWLDAPNEFSASKVEVGAWLDFTGFGRRRTHPFIELCGPAVATPVFAAIGALVFGSADRSISNGSPVTWNSETYDDGSYHSTSSSTERLTIPSGITRGRLITNVNISDIRPLMNRKNNATFRGRGFAYSESSIGNTAANGASAIIPVAAGDYFTLHNEGTTASTVRANLSWMAFEPVDEALRGALAYKSTTQSITGGNITALSFDSEDYDTGGFHDNVTSNSRLTVGSGITLVRLSGAFKTVTGAASDQSVLSMLKNGASFAGAGQKDVEPLISTTQYVSAVSAVLAVSASDYFELRAFTSSNSTIQASDETWFQIEEIPSTRKYAVVQKSANQSVTNGAWTTLTWNTELADTNGMHDNVTNNARLTVPAGCTRARLSFNVSNVTVAGQHNVRVIKNGVSDIPGLPVNDTASAGVDSNNGLGAWIDVEEGDYFELQYFTSTAGVSVASADTTWFCMECE